MRARELFRNHGCEVDSETNRVKFPRAIVEKYIKVLPPKFTFHGRDPKYDRTIPDQSPVIVTGSSAPDILDPVTGVERRAVIADIVHSGIANPQSSETVCLPKPPDLPVRPAAQDRLTIR